MSEISIFDQLNYIRVHVLLEVEPYSNRYHRILMNRDQFKKFSAFMFDNVADKKDPNHKCMNPKCEGKSYEVDDDEITLPDFPDVVEPKQ